MFTHSFSHSFTRLIIHSFTLHSSIVYYMPSLGKKKCEEDRHCSLQWSILDYSQQKFIVKHFSLYSRIPVLPLPHKGLQHWARNPLDGEVLNRGNGVGRGRGSVDRRRIHSVEGWGHSPPHLTNWRPCNKFLGSKWSYGCYLTMESQATLGRNRLKIAYFRIHNSETQI